MEGQKIAVERLHISDQVVALCAARAFGSWPHGSTHRESDLIDRIHAAGYEIVRKSE